MKQTQNFPKELLFISRNMNLVRSLNKYYGGIADRISIMAKSAYVGAQTDQQHKPRSGIYYFASEVGFYTRIYLLQITNWLLKIVSGKYVDDYVEDNQTKNTEEMFKKYGFKPIDEKTYSA